MEIGIKDERSKNLFDNRRVFCICEKSMICAIQLICQGSTEKM